MFIQRPLELRSSGSVRRVANRFRSNDTRPGPLPVVVSREKSRGICKSRAGANIYSRSKAIGKLIVTDTLTIGEDLNGSQWTDSNRFKVVEFDALNL